MELVCTLRRSMLQSTFGDAAKGMVMTPEQHAVEWWGDQSYPKGPDWQALLRQFEKCRDEARNAALDDAVAVLAEFDGTVNDAIRQRLEALKGG